jgi:hypothetical protein
VPLRVQVLHQHERHARGRRKVSEQFGKGVQSARRRADADDGKRGRWRVADVGT